MNDEEVSLPRVSYRSLRVAAYTAIREAILAGQLKPGERLLEVDLAQQLGISRAPVREAIRQLESEGLVVGLPHRGTFVVKLSPQDLWEIYTLRAAIEGLAVHLVASAPDPEIIQKLEALVQQMRDAAERDQRKELPRLDLLFHETICQATGHRRLIEAWQSMHAQVKMFISLSGHYEVPPQQLVAYHEEVLAAIRSADPAQAEKLLREHILTVGERIVTTLQEKDQG